MVGRSTAPGRTTGLKALYAGALSALCLAAAACGPAADADPTPDLVADAVDGADAAGEAEVGEAAQALSGDCSVKILELVPAVRQPTLGGGVTIRTSGTCLQGVAPEFRFLLRRSTEEQVLCDWQAGSECSRPAVTVPSAGSYTLVAQARRTGQTEPDATVSRAYAFGPICTAVTAAVAAQPDGKIGVVATATCDPGAVLEYAFHVLPPGKAWMVFALRQASPSATWDPTGSPPGRAYFRVSVNRRFEPRADKTSAQVPYDIGAACTASQLTVVGTATSKTLTATAACGPGATPEYQFSTEAPDGTASPLRAWAPAGTATWNVSGLAAGKYRVLAEVRAAQNPAQLGSRTEKVVQVGKAQTVTLAPLPGVLPMDRAVHFVASTTCASPETSFKLRPVTGTAWTTACEFSTSTTCVWQPPGGLTPGEYTLEIQTRVAGSTLLQATAKVPFVLGSCASGACGPNPGWLAADGDFYHTCAIRTDHGLTCWGMTPNGMMLPPDGEFSAVGAGREFGCGLRTDGTLACWTANLGWGSDLDALAQPPAGTFSSLSAGTNHACAVRTGGTVACWGASAHGESTPPGGTFSQVSAGGYHTCGLRTNRTVACWGSAASPAITPPTGTFSSLGSGSNFTCGVRTNGTLACWGNNDWGQTIAPSGTFSAVSGGQGHTCGLKTDGTITCWGDPERGGPPSGTFTTVATGLFHSCGIRADASMVCWGYNATGQATPPG